MLEAIINQKQEKLAPKIFELFKDKYPKEFEGEKPKDDIFEPSTYGVKVEFPAEVLEYNIWGWLKKDMYWRALNYVKEIADICRLDVFSEDDLKQMADLIVREIFEGKIIAAGIPVYSDAWKILEPSAIGKYMTEEHKKDAVNIGFWSNLGRIGQDLTFKNEVLVELGNIIDYERFYNLFDFEKGAEKAAELPDIIERFDEWKNDLASLFPSYTYLAWYSIQERFIRSKFKNADEICAKLAAPLIYQLMTLKDYDREERSMKTIANVFIRPSILAEKPIQFVLGNVFEKELEHAFVGEDHWFSKESYEMSKRLLKNPGEHAAKVWEKVKGKLDYRKVLGCAKEFIPKKYFEDYSSGLADRIKAMERLDISLFSEMMNASEMSDAMKSRLRNFALNVYFEQKPRPNGKDAAQLLHFNLGNLQHKANGYLFADLVARKEWQNANSLLMKYEFFWWDRQLRMPRRKGPKIFLESVNEYIEKFGKIKINEKGLARNAIYPNYNKIIDFYEAHKDMFEKEDLRQMKMFK
jgi:hypothetical protein